MPVIDVAPMRIGRASLSAFLLLAAAPPGEDAAHREDRMRTQALNARSGTDYGGPSGGGATSATDLRRYEDARAEYRRRLDAWRRRVAACEAGAYEACGG